MDPVRKEIIIKEINYWKKNNLLPSKYCDFLLSLYTGGEGNSSQLEHHPIKKLKVLGTMALVTFMLLITFLVIYFTDFPMVMQITIGLLSALIIFTIARKSSSNTPFIGHFYYLITAILLFVFMVVVVDFFFPNNKTIIGLTILVTCMGWLVIGVKWKLKYFFIAGSAGLLLLILFQFTL